MQDSNSRISEVFDGLRLLAGSVFPKKCEGCGKVYDDLDQFIDETMPVDSRSGLKETVDQGQKPQLEIVRVCECGGRLIARCEDRRATSELGAKRRDLFEHLLGILSEGGMPRGMAKTEILKVMRGEKSELLTTEHLQRFFS